MGVGVWVNRFVLLWGVVCVVGCVGGGVWEKKMGGCGKVEWGWGGGGGGLGRHVLG